MGWATQCRKCDCDIWLYCEYDDRICEDCDDDSEETEEEVPDAPKD